MLRNKKIMIAPLGLVGLTILSGAFLMSERSVATSTSTTAAVTVAEACTMSATVDSAHSATVPPNTYQADIGTTTLKVTCNDPSGFAIYAVGYTGNEIGGTDSTKLVSNDSSIATGTATSGSASNWAMKLSTSGSSYVATLDNSFGSYHAVPSEYTKVAHYNSATDAGSNPTGSTLQTTYATFITGTQAAGNYLGKVKYTMVHPVNEMVPHEVACLAGKICYNPNTNIVEGRMGQQTISSSDTTTTLYASNFKKTGYGFAGWTDKYDYETNEEAHFYGPNQDITFTAGQYTDNNDGLSLYAVWIKSAGTIQNWNGCSSLTQATIDGTANLSSVTALTDKRDNNTYAVGRLADGKCWIIENLRLADKDNINNDINLSPSNTHNPSLPLTNIYDSSTTSNHLSPTSSVAYDATNAPDGWCQTDSSACDDQSRLRTDNTTLFTNNNSGSQSSNIYSYGNYYNWYSATAGNSTYGDSSGNAGGDICPVGWRLPTGKDATGDFGLLDVAMGGTGDYQSSEYGVGENPVVKWRAFPNNFLFSGQVRGSSIRDRGSYIFYWSSSIYTSSHAYGFHSSEQLYTGNRLYPGSFNLQKNYGFVVRCIIGV